MHSAGHEFPPNFPQVFQKLRTCLLAFLCIVLGLKALIFFARATLTVLYPFEWSTMDGYFVYHGMRLVSGRPIYFDTNSLLMPFEYVPLYPAFIGVLAKLFGPGVWYERCFSLVCSLAISALVARAVKRSTRNTSAAVAAGLILFGPAALSVWFIVRGIDIFAALLGLLGVSIVAEDEEGSTSRLILAAIVLTLAFYAKQTSFFPAAAAVMYVLCKDLKKGLFMGGSLALATAVIFFLLQVLSDGWFFENAFVMTMSNPYYTRILSGLARDFSLCLVIVFPVALFQASRGAGRRPDIWTLYFLFTLLSGLLAGKLGAALTYFIPLFSAICICLGLLLGDSGLFARRPRTYLVVLVAILVQGVLFYAHYVPIPSRQHSSRARVLDAYVKDNPGAILTERIDSFAVLNDRELNVEAVQLPILIMRRKYDPQTLLELIENKEFSLIIYSSIYFGGIPALRHAIFENYRAIDRISIGLFYGETTFLVLTPV